MLGHLQRMNAATQSNKCERQIPKSTRKRANQNRVGIVVGRITEA